VQKAALPVYPPGARVVIRDEEWLVRATQPASATGVAVHVVGLSELVRNRKAIFRSELDTIIELKPEDTQLVVDPSPGFRRSRLYLESLLRRTPPTDDRIYVGHRGAMDKAPYQLVPAAKALRQPRARILIADGVGLGKTLEVGVLLSELIQRGRGDRILVVALKSILTQFQQELWSRFAIPLVRLDSVGLERVRAKIPSNMNPFHYYGRVIISIDTLKRDEKNYRTFLSQADWDVVVVDECQNVAVKGRSFSDRARLASLLARRCNALVLTSATPHDGTAESFASLMNLLEPTTVADPTSYTREDVDSLFVRRFKKDVQSEAQGCFLEREVQLVHERATTEEDDVFKVLNQVSFHTIDRHRCARGGGVLFRTTLLKAFLSSPAACMSTIDERLKHKDLRSDEDQAAQHDRHVLIDLRERVSRVVVPAKVLRLIQILKSMKIVGAKCKERVVIFSERIHTLRMLEALLPKELDIPSQAIALFHGTLDDQRQQELVAGFGCEKTPLRILLASDVASEGINLHFHCHRLIHFDIPWSLIRMEQRNGRIDRFGQKKIPDVRYLLTVPADPALKGDLRILERLIERETQAAKNIGDVAWLLRLHDADKEEERVGTAIQSHEDPDLLFPNEDGPLDFLGMLLQEDDPQAKKEALPETVDPVSLFTSDEAFVRVAFEEAAADSGDVTLPEWSADGRSLILAPSQDLEARLAYLPKEVQAKDGELHLTTDRARMTVAIEKAREAGEWPTEQLLTNLHPVMEWLGDRVLGSFTRLEAPIITVPRGLDGGRACFLVQGVLSNQLSQPVVVDWFGVLFGDGQVITFDELAARVGLSAEIANERRPVDPEPLQRLLPKAIQKAHEWMKAFRSDRDRRLAEPLRAELRRVNHWHERIAGKLDAERQRIVDGGRGIRSDEEKRFAEKQAYADGIRHDRNIWIDRRLRTGDVAHLRVAAVFVPKAVKS
jgi:ERCC4-related helicase